MSSKSTLKKCPFCGAPATPPENIYKNKSRRPSWAIGCSAWCVTMYATSRKEVIERWNKRTE